MYFVLQSQVFDYLGKTVHAKLLFRPKFNQFWWFGQPMSEPVPAIPFLIPKIPDYPDHFFTGTEFDLLSPRLVAIFADKGVHFEAFPVGMIETGSNLEKDMNYSNVRVLDIFDFIDPKKSQITTRGIKKIVFQKSAYENPKMAFRLLNSESLLIIHEDIKNTIERQKLSGCSIKPIESFTVGYGFS
jgi:hypothetical protein